MHRGRNGEVGPCNKKNSIPMPVKLLGCHHQHTCTTVTSILFLLTVILLNHSLKSWEWRELSWTLVPLIVKWILLVSNKENWLSGVWRIWKLVLRCNGLIQNEFCKFTTDWSGECWSMYSCKVWPWKWWGSKKIVRKSPSRTKWATGCSCEQCLQRS